jgi:hypothetical protein
MALRAFPNDDSMHALARYLLASAVLQLLFLAHFLLTPFLSRPSTDCTPGVPTERFSKLERES